MKLQDVVFISDLSCPFILAAPSGAQLQLIADALSRKNKRKNFKPRNIADINVDEDENVIVNHQETGASPTPIDLSRYEIRSTCDLVYKGFS